jgi:hypothetical protein
LISLVCLWSLLLSITASGYEQKALVAQPADSSPGTLARILSRRKSHHGAIFASPGERLNCPGLRNCPEPVLRNWQTDDKFCVTIKQSRWRAKIVTSFLVIPACYVLGGILKTRTLAIISLMYYSTR